MQSVTLLPCSGEEKQFTPAPGLDMVRFLFVVVWDVSRGVYGE